MIRPGDTIYPAFDHRQDGLGAPQFGHARCMVRYARELRQREAAQEQELHRNRRSEEVIERLRQLRGEADAPRRRDSDEKLRARYPVDVIRLCENVLGFHPPDDVERADFGAWRWAEAGKLSAELRRRPDITVSDLVKAIEYCQQKKMTIKSSPAALLPVLARQLRHQPQRSGEAPTSPTREAIVTAYYWEIQQGESGESDRWAGRLIRSSGYGRRLTLAEWLAVGRGSTDLRDAVQDALDVSGSPAVEAVDT